MVDKNDVTEGKVRTSSRKMTRICLSGWVEGTLFGRWKVAVTARDVLAVFA